MEVILFALLILITGLKFVLSPKEGAEIIKLTSKNEEAIMLSGMVSLMFAFFIFLHSGLNPEFEWDNLFFWIGAMATIKGLVRLFTPKTSMKVLKRIKAPQVPIWGFFAIMLGLALIVIETQLV